MFDSGVLILTISFGNVTQNLHQADNSSESGPAKDSFCYFQTEAVSRLSLAWKRPQPGLLIFQEHYSGSKELDALGVVPTLFNDVVLHLVVETAEHQDIL